MISYIDHHLAVLARAPITARDGRSSHRMKYLYYIVLLLLLFSLIPYAYANWDPYEILGVKQNASLGQIKKAYRDLARKLHPDKSNLGEGEAEKKFIEINKAFNILKDPEKRRRFDLSLADRVVWRGVDYSFRTFYYLTSRESFSSSIVVLVICALFTSLYLYHSHLKSDSSNKPHSSHDCKDNPKRRTNLGGTNTHQENVNTNHRMKIMELKAETYNGMVRLLKPGYRSIVLLVDRESRDKLMPKFEKAVWPYRRNKSLLFGYLCLDRNLEWYKILLQEAVGATDLRVNKKKCVGTVLSLNGFKKYFRIYHVKHHEIDRYDDETDNDGSFLGFDQDTNGDIESSKGQYEQTFGQEGAQQEPCTLDNLLDRLPIWLDKMFDGMTKRYLLESWPEEMN